jgi:1-acyl-sn-glycerol-3-phosphate acyltransferase
MREVLTQVLGATRATASVMARDLLGFRAEDPLGERDPVFIRETLPGLGRLANLYFRPKVRGLEQIPDEGPVLLVGNHSGGTLIADTFAFAYCFYNHFGPDRRFHQLAHDLVFQVPGLAPLRKYGTIPANHKNAMAALRKGAALLVYPGGDHETYRPSWHSGEIDFGHRSGFVRLALAADVPIVPVVAIGGQETALFLTRGERLSHLLALDRLLRLKVMPIQIAPPFGVTVLDLPGRFPLPSQITIQVLPRIDLRRRFGPDADEEAVYHAVTAMMQEALDELSAERDLPVVGTLGPRVEESAVVEDLEHGGLEREVEAAIEAESSEPAS